MEENGQSQNPGVTKHRVVVIGLDACDVDLVQRWAGEGRLPFLASLMERGVWARMESTEGLFNDSPWPSLHTGVSPAKHAFYNYLQLKAGTTQIERVDAHHCHYLPFWSLLRGSGKKVAVCDVPKTFPIEGINGVQISAWSEHYPLFKQPTSLPLDAVKDVMSRFGRYAHPPEISKASIVPQERSICKTLRANLEKSQRAFEYLMKQDDWDFFMSVFSEAHYAGHQFYHHYDEKHWAHEPDAPADLRTALPDLYARTDAALSRLFEHISEDTTFFILSVHGIYATYSANHLMAEVLEKLCFTIPAAREQQKKQQRAAIGIMLRGTESVRKLIPQAMRDYINTHMVPESAHDKAFSDEFSNGVDWGKTRAVFLPSDHFQGFIRVNVKGREPSGIVEPGNELDATCHEIRDELKRLVNPETGKPAVLDVVRTSDRYQGEHLADLPDLIIQWAEDAPIRQLQHPRFGVVSTPRGFEPRRAQHAPDGFLIAGGKGIKRDAVLNGITTLDFAPTILHLLGQPIPEYMDGRILFELLHDGSHSGAGASGEATSLRQQSAATGLGV
jgi:predicted AlkP superfamily phosphohydrolase/phosphomutase